MIKRASGRIINFCGPNLLCKPSSFPSISIWYAACAGGILQNEINGAYGFKSLASTNFATSAGQSFSDASQSRQAILCDRKLVLEARLVAALQRSDIA
jgi:hypothetical protein